MVYKLHRQIKNKEYKLGFLGLITLLISDWINLWDTYL